MNKLQLHAGSPKGSRRALDFYPTPPECTHALMQFLKLDKCTVWECAAGEGHMANVIRQYGHEVIETDIKEDFLKTSIPCDAIITNPPFNLSAQFIAKAVSEAPTVAMLLKSQYWHANSRLKLFRELTPAYILPLTWRPNFTQQPKASPTMEVAWSVWQWGSKSCQYWPLNKPPKLSP